MSFFLCYRTLLYNSEIYNGTVLHSQPMLMGMDSSKQYYGIYLDTRGAPVQLEVMPGYEKKLIEHNGCVILLQHFAKCKNQKCIFFLLKIA